MLKNLKFILSLIFLSVCFPATVCAINITLQWTSNNEPSLAGYKTFYREEGQPYDYESPYRESIDPVCTVYDLPESVNSGSIKGFLRFPAPGTIEAGLLSAQANYEGNLWHIGKDNLFYRDSSKITIRNFNIYK